MAAVRGPYDDRAAGSRGSLHGSARTWARGVQLGWGDLHTPYHNDRKASSPEWNRTFSIIHWLVVTGTMEFLWLFRNSWEFHHPNWRTPWFFRGVGRYTTNQFSMCRSSPCELHFDFPVGWLGTAQQGLTYVDLLDRIHPPRENQTEWKNMGLSENSVPLNPMVNDHYTY